MTIVQNRDAVIRNFLAAHGWAGASQAPLAGDASSRRYTRLSQGSETIMLMDAPPAICGPLKPFVDIAHHLRHHDLRAPDILAADEAQGLMLLED